MSDDEQREASRKLQLAGELHRAGVEIYRAKMRREHPEATERELDLLVGAWLRTRPGAEHGDAVGRRIPDHPALKPLNDSNSS